MLPYRSLDVSWSFLYRQNVIFNFAANNITGFKNEFGRTYASTPDVSGNYTSAAVETQFEPLFCVGFVSLPLPEKEMQISWIRFNRKRFRVSG